MKYNMLISKIFGEDTLFNIHFNYIYCYLFCATFMSIILVNDYYYLYLIFIDCLVVLLFKHFYFDYTKFESKYKSRYVYEIIDNQWLWMLILCCHIKFCFLTIKEEFIELNYIS
jgi:hypothetical protein